MNAHLPSVALAVLLGTAVGMARGEAPAAPARLDCVDVPATIVTDRLRDATLACDGARDAFGFLAPLGLTAPARLHVELVPALPAGLRGDAVGCYAIQSRRILVLHHDTFVQRRAWFGVPVEPALWRSVVAHEVAHALLGCHLGERPLPPAAHEYVAYVTMFATMAPSLRERALANLPGTGFDDVRQINPLVYGFDPMRFGADAYRHWRRLPDGMGFLREVIAGQAIPEMFPN